MKTITAYPSDRFSFGRLSMVARYYWPTVRLQVIAYPLISIAAAVIIVLCKSNMTTALLITGLLAMPLSLLLNFGPLVFAFKSNQEIETMIPARTSEKSTFLILYNMVVMPFLLLFPKWIILQMFYPDMAVALAGSSEGADLVQDLLEENTWWKQLISLAQTLLPISVCMFCVFKIRKRRVLMSIVWTIVSIMLPALIGIAFGIWFALSDAIANLENGGNFKTEFIDVIMPLTWTICSVATLIDILFCWLTTRAIRRNQY